MGGDEGLARRCRRVVVALSSSHVRVGSEDGAWARRHHRCVVIVAYGGREGVAGMQTRATGTGMQTRATGTGMQTRATGTGMSAGQQERTRTRTRAIPVM